MQHLKNAKTCNEIKNCLRKNIPLVQKEQVQFFRNSTPTSPPACASKFSPSWFLRAEHRSNPGNIEPDTIGGSTDPPAHWKDPKLSSCSIPRSINPSFWDLPTKLSFESSVPVPVPPLGKLGSCEEVLPEKGNSEQGFLPLSLWHIFLSKFSAPS